ncbi:MAG: hypothetical protein MOB07_10505 [Acidobacteria bacterium]|nr:hypothetical protein [Acidobacteriota bacterium]
MEPQKEQIAPEIIQAIVTKAALRGLSVNDYLAQLLGLENGHEGEISLSGTPWEDVEHLIGSFDSREPFERPDVEQDAFTRSVIADLARQGIKLP